MKIRRNDENRITVELCKEDLYTLGIKREDIFAQNKETKKILFNLLKRVSREMCCNLDSESKIIINSGNPQNENYSLKITLLKSAVDSKGKRYKDFFDFKSSYSVYEFTSANSLLEASFACGGETLLINSALYEKGGKYRLVVYSPDDCFALCVLNEFASNVFSGEIEAASTREHWNKIISEHALSSLSLRYVL